MEKSSVRFIKKSAVKDFVGQKGKWVSPSFYAWLDRKVHETLDRHIHNIGSRTKLTGGEAEECEQLMRRLRA